MKMLLQQTAYEEILQLPHLINEAMLPQNKRNYMDDQKSTKSLKL